MDKVVSEFRQRTAAPGDADPSGPRDADPCCRIRAAEDIPDDDMAGLGPTHPVSADLVGRTVAGLAIVSQLLRHEAATKGPRESLCDPERPTALIVEWGISLAWADNPVVTYADETLIDNTVRALASGAACIGIGSEAVYQGDLVQLHHTLIDTIAALQAPLWRRP